MLIAVDIDEVLADFVANFVNIYNKIYKTSFTRDDFFVFEFWTILGLDLDEFKKRFIKMIRENRLFESPLPKKGSQEAIKTLAESHRLAAVTGRPESIADITQNWLKKYFPSTFEKIYYARKDVLQPEKESKFSICKRIGAKILIEDEVNNAETAARNGLQILLFDAPWNKKVKTGPKLKRVYSWDDVLSYFMKHNKI